MCSYNGFRATLPPKMTHASNQTTGRATKNPKKEIRKPEGWDIWLLSATIRPYSRLTPSVATLGLGLASNLQELT